jgi:hypothetical protein
VKYKQIVIGKETIWRISYNMKTSLIGTVLFEMIFDVLENVFIFCENA